MAEFDFIKKDRENIPKDTKIYVKKSFDILERIHELMEELNLSQKELAERMGKKEPEISKWINGSQNFTLKTLSKLEAALGEDIIRVPCKRNHVTELKQIQILQRQMILGSRHPLEARRRPFFKSWTNYLSQGLIIGGVGIIEEPTNKVVCVTKYSGRRGKHNVEGKWITLKNADDIEENQLQMTKNGV